MKKRNLQRIFAAFIASAMAMNLAGCAGEEAKPVEKPADKPVEQKEKEKDKDETVDLFKDANGKVMDLGGMEIIIRDWFTSDTPAEATTGFDEATQEWRDYIQKTYNFKVKQVKMSEWADTPTDFVDYVTTGGDDQNYAFYLWSGSAVVSAISSGLMYDLSSIKCLNFNDDMFQTNKTHDMYTNSNGIFAMAAGLSEPRTGCYFNNTVLKDAGIDPNTIYDMQKNGTWTWDAFEQILAKCQRDLDNDGVNDIFGLSLNESYMTNAAVFSNGGSYVGVNADGYFYNLESPETLEALEWTVDMFNKFDNHDPADAQWDYYKEEWAAGKAACLVDDAYCGQQGQLFGDVNFEMSFVMFPKGPKGDTYVNAWNNNLVVIPSCYDADRAEKIAFAWMLYNMPIPGYESHYNYSSYRAGSFDERAVDETLPMMQEGIHGTVDLSGIIPSLDLGPDLTWGITPNAVVSEKVEATREKWQTYINAANGK